MARHLYISEDLVSEGSVGHQIPGISRDGWLDVFNLRTVLSSRVSQPLCVASRVPSEHSNDFTQHLLTAIYGQKLDNAQYMAALAACPELCWLTECNNKAPLPPGWQKTLPPDGGATYHCELTERISHVPPHFDYFVRLGKFMALARRSPEDALVAMEWIRDLVDELTSEVAQIGQTWSGPHLDVSTQAEYYHCISTGLSIWGNPARNSLFIVSVARRLLDAEPFAPYRTQPSAASPRSIRKSGGRPSMAQVAVALSSAGAEDVPGAVSGALTGTWAAAVVGACSDPGAPEPYSRQDHGGDAESSCEVLLRTARIRQTCSHEVCVERSQVQHDAGDAKDVHVCDAPALQTSISSKAASTGEQPETPRLSQQEADAVADARTLRGAVVNLEQQVAQLQRQIPLHAQKTLPAIPTVDDMHALWQAMDSLRKTLPHTESPGRSLHRPPRPSCSSGRISRASRAESRSPRTAYCSPRSELERVLSPHRREVDQRAEIFENAPAHFSTH